MKLHNLKEEVIYYSSEIKYQDTWESSSKHFYLPTL